MYLEEKGFCDYIQGIKKQNSICICGVVRQDAEPSIYSDSPTGLSEIIMDSMSIVIC